MVKLRVDTWDESMARYDAVELIDPGIADLACQAAIGYRLV